ncbi:MAG: hypothetical protein AAB931_00195 [Patescibacteria group bacterium]
MSKLIEGDMKPAGPEIVMRKPIFIFDIDRVLFDTERFYATNFTEYMGYPGDAESLNALRRLGRLVIFSEILEKDPRDFQLKKLRRLGFIEHFEDEDIHIHNKKMSKLAEILRRYGGLIFLIDDNPEIIEEAKRLAELDKGKNYELVVVWMKRGNYAKKAEEEGRAWTFSPDETVSSLEKLVAKVNERLGAQNPTV